jgi:hypothetical protein
MNCPLKLIAYTIAPIQTTLTYDCDQEKCAWWFGAQCCCSLPAIANLLDSKTWKFWRIGL